MKAIQLFLIIATFFVSVSAKELEKVSLQLMWLDQFQFAGYYMAKEKGYYKDVGLEVEFKSFKKNMNTLDEVTSARATYGIGRSSLIVDKSNGAKIKLLAAIFQSTPLILLARADSDIKTISDFKSKRIMTTNDASLVASVLAMMNRENLDLSDMVVQQHSFNINDLINKKTDLMAGYISNEPYYLKSRGIDYKVFDPKDYGFDFYSDIIFTSDSEVKNHNQRTRDFIIASIKGWEYAFSHIQESVQVLLDKYNVQHKSRASLVYEAEALKKLAYYKTNTIGILDENKIQRIYDIYNIIGLSKNKIDIKDLVFNYKGDRNIDLTTEEKEYLKKKKFLTMCVIPDALPYSKISNGEYIGMSAEYMKLLSEKLHTSFILVPTKDIIESIDYVTKGKCDFLSIIHKGRKLGQTITYSQTFFETSLVIVTQNNSIYIPNIESIIDKTIAIPKGYYQVNYLKNKYPNIKIIEVNNSVDGLKKVDSGEVYAFVGNLESAVYEIQRHYLKRLKVSGTTGEPIRVGMAISNKDSHLVDVLNKAISSISESKKEFILKNWLNTQYQRVIDYTLVWQLIAFFILVLILITIFILKQNRLKKKIEILNNNLEKKVQAQVKELAKSVKMFEIIFDTVKDGIAIIDLNSNFLLVNKAYEKMTGLAKEKLYKTSCVALTEPSMIEESKKILAQTIKNGYYYGYEKQCKINNEGFIDVVLDLILMDDKKSILMVTKDITKQNKYKKEKELQTQQMFQQSKLVQMGEMISMIAHQWRQPLGAIASTTIDLQLKLELEVFDIETDEGRTAASEYFISKLKTVEMLTQSLTSTIDDFRDFYKPTRLTEFMQIDKPIKKALDIIRVSFTTDNIELIEEYGATTELQLYSSEVMQVILNILKNSQDNFKQKNVDGAYIKIVTSDIINGVSIDIYDNGGGISEDIIDKIFDPYFSTKEDKNGTGLGLYMSKMIIEEHHKGSLSVKNINNGIYFRLELLNQKK